MIPIQKEAPVQYNKIFISSFTILDMGIKAMDNAKTNKNVEYTYSIFFRCFKDTTEYLLIISPTYSINSELPVKPIST